MTSSQLGALDFETAARIKRAGTAARPADLELTVVCPRCAAAVAAPCTRRGGRPHATRLNAVLDALARTHLHR